MCSDGVYCDGAERCDIRDDCVEGDVVACSDNTTCTIDVCVEESQSCRHDPRDADGDGDPTRNCGGHDCDDSDPRVSSMVSEVCGNERDDNCDGAVDEAGCAVPEHDTCDTALSVTESGYYDMDLTATALDYPTTCATPPVLDQDQVEQQAGYRDAVLEIAVPAGGPFDVDVTAKLDAGHVALATADQCGEAKSLSCTRSFALPLGGSVSRLLLRDVSGGRIPVYVAADVEATAQIHVELRAAEPMPGELCEDAVPLVAGGAPVVLRLPGYATDESTACEPPRPEAERNSSARVGVIAGDGFVSFELEQARDVTVIAESEAGLSVPIIGLLDSSCQTELTCRHSQPGRLFERNLGPGKYYVLVAATAPDDVSVRLETGPVSLAPPGEGCDDPPALVSGVEQLVELSTHEDAVHPQCLVGAPDATFQVDLAGQRDVAVIGRFSDGDVGAVSFGSAAAACNSNSSCRAGAGTVRTVRYGVPAGNYRAVIESAQGNPVGISWFERPPLAAVNVPFADDCTSPVQIPEVGGRFTGNTSNVFADFNAGCDVGGQSEGGAPDQLLELTLTEPRRVILDMQGSSYDTMLSVREGQFCPGAELQLACAPGYRATRSYLDLDLQAGHYFVQIDGYNGASGAWRLDVFTAALE